MFQAKISLRPTQAERKLGAKAEALLVVLACHKNGQHFMSAARE